MPCLQLNLQCTLLVIWVLDFLCVNLYKMDNSSITKQCTSSIAIGLDFHSRCLEFAFHSIIAPRGIENANMQSFLRAEDKMAEKVYNTYCNYHSLRL